MHVNFPLLSGGHKSYQQNALYSSRPVYHIIWKLCVCESYQFIRWTDFLIYKLETLCKAAILVLSVCPYLQSPVGNDLVISSINNNLDVPLLWFFDVCHVVWTVNTAYSCFPTAADPSLSPHYWSHATPSFSADLTHAARLLGTCSEVLLLFGCSGLAASQCVRSSVCLLFITDIITT